MGTFGFKPAVYVHTDTADVLFLQFGVMRNLYLKIKKINSLNVLYKFMVYHSSPQRWIMAKGKINVVFILFLFFFKLINLFIDLFIYFF